MVTTYYVIEENVEVIGKFKGDPILHPKYQCSRCGHVISPGFAQTTGKCGYCYEGKNEIGEYLDRIYAVTFYASGGAFEDHKFTNAIGKVKEGEFADEMSDILKWGVENFDNLGQADYIVPPPRGDSDADINHMKKLATN